LFSGTVRDNLLVGLEDLGDDVCLDVARKSGLYQSVLAPHPKGLARFIHEGGYGLSGGQRQLVHITRAMLRKPKVWLLDEPTASMDSQTERQVIEALYEHQRRSGATFVIVTHKPQVVALANRVIVIVSGKIVLDGPRDEVLKRLQSKSVDDRNAVAVA
jgi:ATP-binding cassette subfamily C protein LapB